MVSFEGAPQRGSIYDVLTELTDGLTMAADARVKITLACTECKQRNYNTYKNKKNDPERLEFSKYCRFCRKHTTHRESK